MGGLGGVKGKGGANAMKRVNAVRKSRAEVSEKSRQNVAGRSKRSEAHEEENLKAEKEEKQRAKKARAQQFLYRYNDDDCDGELAADSEGEMRENTTERDGEEGGMSSESRSAAPLEGSEVQELRTVTEPAREAITEGSEVAAVVVSEVSTVSAVLAGLAVSAVSDPAEL